MAQFLHNFNIKYMEGEPISEWSIQEQHQLGDEIYA